MSSTPVASILIPTRGRPAYLDVALESIVGQAQSLGAEVLVVNDGGGAAVDAVAERHGARVVAGARARAESMSPATPGSLPPRRI